MSLSVTLYLGRSDRYVTSRSLDMALLPVIAVKNIRRDVNKERLINDMHRILTNLLKGHFGAEVEYYIIK